MMWNTTGGSGAWAVMGGVSMILFWIVFIGGSIWLIRSRQRPGTARPDARTILDERLARGELTDDEYQRRTALLNRR